MSHDSGAWLRAQRQSRGWNVPEMARQLRLAAKANGDTSLPGNKTVCSYVRRWERGGLCPSERYQLHYCRAFGISPQQYGPSAPSEFPGDPADTAVTPSSLPAVLEPRLAHATGGRGLPSVPLVAYRETQEPDLGCSWIDQEVVMAAREGSEHATRAERRDIGEATLEQLRADTVRLSRGCDTEDPFPLFLDARRVRGRIYAALDLRLWPRDQVELYFLLACLNGLMGVTADRLGYTSAGEELIRAGWAYATAIDHRPLLAQLRQQLAAMAYRSGRPRECRDLASSGLQYLSAGPNGANLHLKFALAAARLGDTAGAHRAIAAAHDARDRDHHDELLEIGGEYAISLATHHYFAGAALAEITGAEQEIAGELERATSLYAAGPAPGEEHWVGGRALASIDLATVRLRTGSLDAATAVLEPVLSLPPSQRITAVTTRLIRVRAELAQPRYQGSAEARDLDERIEDFTRDTITAGLHDLPGAPA